MTPVAARLQPAFGAAETGRPVTDMVGRTLRLPAEIRRIVLLDARDIISMALLHPEPANLVAGWAGPEVLDSDLLRARYDDAHPGAGAIQVIGGQTADTISLESILALAPDLVVSTAHIEPELDDGPLARRLADAGIPVLFSNAASNADSAEQSGTPMDELPALMSMWGAVLGREQKATAFTSFVSERLTTLRRQLDGAAPRKTYLELQSTYDDCCWAAGNRVWGELLRLAGGRGLDAVSAPWFAKLGIEQLIAEAPEIYIACGGAFASTLRPAIGPGLPKEDARDGLRRLCARTGFSTLPAVREGHVHGIWTGLVAIQPLNILFLEIVAKWLHPEHLPDLDPQATLEEINRRFLAAPIDGPCWLSLQEDTRNG